MKRSFSQVVEEDLDNQTTEYLESNKNNNTSMHWLYDNYIINNKELRKDFITLMGKQGIDYERNSFNSCLPTQAIITAIKLINKHKLLEATKINKKFREDGCSVRIIDYNYQNEDKRDYELVEC